MTVSADLLRSLLSYDAESGLFTWKRSRQMRPGCPAGGTNAKLGYVQIHVCGKRYYAHRLAWLYVHSEWPAEIDHINGDRSDNRLANLRPVTRAQNNWNSRALKRPHNTSSYKGVGRHTKSKRNPWRAQISVNNKTLNLGYFPTEEAARLAYKEAAERYFGVYARTS